MPVIHKSRQDVARLFRAKLHATDDEVADAPRMTALARRCCARAFCRPTWASPAATSASPKPAASAPTNEGNGRLTTSLPRVHVALMGIERIVPRLDDLGVMLQVLDRSASGQEMTGVLQRHSGPRRHGRDGRESESDGPEQFHVVLVDNGRSTLVGSDLAEILYCIRCGACLNSCPVYQQIGGHAYGSGYPGPVGAVLMPALQGLHKWGDLPQASSLCGACRKVCPVRIDVPQILLKHRDTTNEIGADANLGDVRTDASCLRRIATRPALFAARAGPGQLGDATTGHRRVE